MLPAATKCRVLRFGIFELELETQDLRKRGVRFKFGLPVFSGPTDVAGAGFAVVTREELCHALWPDEPWGNHAHGLNNTIKRIREALGDSAHHPRYLETLPWVGYRFLVEAERAGKRRRSRRRLLLCCPNLRR